MSHTNSTSNYGLPQWIGTDKPTFLGDFNTAFYDIDVQMKTNADAAAADGRTGTASASAADAGTDSAAAGRKSRIDDEGRREIRISDNDISHLGIS